MINRRQKNWVKRFQKVFRSFFHESGSIRDIPRTKFAKCRSQRRNLIVSDCIRRRIKPLIATSHEDNLASLANPDIAALRFCARSSITSKTVIGWFRRWLEWSLHPCKLKWETARYRKSFPRVPWIFHNLTSPSIFDKRLVHAKCFNGRNFV